MNGNHFAEEFIRRKKLADKGVVVSDRQPAVSVPEPNKPGAGSAAGGWSEVAKKGGNGGGAGQHHSETSIPGFKMVSSRKKGKK